MTMPTLDTERIALSNELHIIAERFILEATMWREPACKSELERAARLIAELARGIASGASELLVGEAYAKAADEILGNVQGARRFFIAVLTVPKVARRHVEP